MTGLATALLGELTEPIANWNPSSSPGQYFKYLDLSCVDQNRKIVSGATPLLTDEAPSRARQLVSAGDVLVSTVRPNLNGVAVVPGVLDGATASTGFTVLRPGSRLDTRYLFHWVQSPQFICDMVRKATGASYPAVSDKIVKASSIPLVPIDEQRRIAAILDEADGLRAMRRAALAHLDDLSQSIFLEMFGDGSAGARGPRSVLLSDIVERVTYGFTNPMTHVPAGIPIVTAMSVRGGEIDLLGGRFTTKADFEQLTDKSKPRPGDVLITKDGSIGRCAVVNDGTRFCINQSVAVIRPIADKVIPDYLVGYLTTPRIQAQMTGMSKGNALKHLQITELAQMPVPAPSIPHQQEYSGRLGQVRSLRGKQLLAASHNESLVESLRERAFAGEL